MAYDSSLDEQIITIVRAQDISEQLDLQMCLKERGYDIPQATLSRRLKKLNIAKIAGIYRLIDLNAPSLPPVLNLQVSEFGLIVLHTHPGYANSLASFIDKQYVTFSSHPQENHFGVLGTIAGDDTVLLILKSQQDLKKFIETLQQVFPYLK